VGLKRSDVIAAGLLSATVVAGLFLVVQLFIDSPPEPTVGAETLTGEEAAPVVPAVSAEPSPEATEVSPPSSLSDVPQGVRSGDLPRIPAVKAERTTSECGYTVDISELTWISHPNLAAIGLGRSSPLVVLEDGAPLRGFASRREFEMQCSGAFAVGRNTIRFSPSENKASAVAADTYAVGFSEELPLVTPDGDVWWVYTDTTVALSVPLDGVSVGRPATLKLKAGTPQNRIQALPTVTVGDVSVELQGEPPWLLAELPIDALSETLEIDVTSPQHGPYLLVQEITLDFEDGDVVSLLSERAVAPENPQPVVAPLPDGTVNILNDSSVSFASPPPSLAQPQEIKPVGEFLGRMELAGLAYISGTEVRNRIGDRNSPVRILEDGVPLPVPNASCNSVKEDGGGQYCHSREVLTFSTVDGSSPSANTREYTVLLDAQRSFSGGWWLYPGDQMSVQAATVAAQGHVLIAATVAEPGVGNLSMTVLREGDALLSQELSASELEGQSNLIPLSDISAGQITVQLVASDYVVLQNLAFAP